MQQWTMTDTPEMFSPVSYAPFNERPCDDESLDMSTVRYNLALTNGAGDVPSCMRTLHLIDAHEKAC
jgi:hypothetical protein